jgi:hypothetical protein
VSLNLNTTPLTLIKFLIKNAFKFFFFFFFNFLALNSWLCYVNKFRFSVWFWTEISAETERWNDTETETEMHTETEISAETETETEIFRSLLKIKFT